MKIIFDLYGKEMKRIVLIILSPIILALAIVIVTYLHSFFSNQAKKQGFAGKDKKIFIKSALTTFFNEIGKKPNRLIA